MREELLLLLAVVRVTITREDGLGDNFSLETQILCLTANVTSLNNDGQTHHEKICTQPSHLSYLSFISHVVQVSTEDYF